MSFAKYPVIGDVTKLLENRFKCISVMKSAEKRLRKQDQFDVFKSQLMEYVTQGVLT